MADLQSKISSADAGVTARVFSDGSTRPYRLVLASQRTGRAGQLMIDTSGLDLSLSETSRGRDALLLVGASGSSSTPLLLTSSTNEFTDALPGADLQVKQSSSTPVTVQVDSSDTDLVASVKAMVDNYNKLRQKLEDDTAYDASQDKKAVLTSDFSTLRLDADLGYFFSGRLSGAGRIQSMGEVGIHLKDDGTLEFNQDELSAKFASDPEAVQDFFTTKETGFSAKFAKLTDTLAGSDSSLLEQRSKALEQTITENKTRIEMMTARLTMQQDNLYMEFYRMEQAVAKLQSQQSAISSIQYIDTVTGNSSSSSSSSS